MIHCDDCVVGQIRAALWLRKRQFYASPSTSVYYRLRSIGCSLTVRHIQLSHLIPLVRHISCAHHLIPTGISPRALPYFTDIAVIVAAAAAAAIARLSSAVVMRAGEKAVRIAGSHFDFSFYSATAHHHHGRQLTALPAATIEVRRTGRPIPSVPMIVAAVVCQLPKPRMLFLLLLLLLMMAMMMIKTHRRKLSDATVNCPPARRAALAPFGVKSAEERRVCV